MYSIPLFSNFSVFVKLLIILIFAIGLYIVAQKIVDRGQMRGWKHFEKAVQDLKGGKITKEEFNKKIEERKWV